MSGGVISTVLLHPLDLLKIRFAVSDGQTRVRPSYSGMKNAVVSIGTSWSWEFQFRWMVTGIAKKRATIMITDLW